MRQRRAMFFLVAVGLLFIAAASVAATIQTAPGTDPNGALVNPSDPGPDNLPAPDDMTPVACRIKPQCSTDEDCLAWCGPTGGHCVHSNCPIRICKCS
jgi:hypothetical protein